MNEGLLWYDDDPKRDLPRKVALAAARYAQKHGGVAPDTCYVHPSALAGTGGGVSVGGVRVRALPTVLRHHFWVGREE